jgi:signal peptidase I
MTAGAETQPAGTAPEKSRKPVSESTFREYVESLLVTVVLALFGTTFIVQAFKIPSQSMEPALLVGDHLLVNKFIFEGRGAWYDRFLPYRSIRHGDIIVFKFPYQDHPHYVKRAIGLPGDRIKIVNQQVYVNDVPVKEPYVIHDPSAADPFGSNFPPKHQDFYYASLQPEWAEQIEKHIVNGELVVPPNEYFAMGDNRDHSWDSRYWGFVDRNAIMGRPVIIYWSVRASSDDYEDGEGNGGASSVLYILLHFPSETRWSRMFHEVH